MAHSVKSTPTYNPGRRRGFPTRVVIFAACASEWLLVLGNASNATGQTTHRPGTTVVLLYNASNATGQPTLQPGEGSPGTTIFNFEALVQQVVNAGRTTTPPISEFVSELQEIWDSLPTTITTTLQPGTTVTIIYTHTTTDFMAGNYIGMPTTSPQFRNRGLNDTDQTTSQPGTTVVLLDNASNATGQTTLQPDETPVVLTTTPRDKGSVEKPVDPEKTDQTIETKRGASESAKTTGAVVAGVTAILVVAGAGVLYYLRQGGGNPDGQGGENPDGQDGRPLNNV